MTGRTFLRRTAVLAALVAGTIATFMLVVILLGARGTPPSRYAGRFEADVQRRVVSTPTPAILTETDIRDLPFPVQNYLRFTGAVGKPRIVNFRAVMRGRMRRGADSAWVEIRSRQYNFFDDPARLFFIESSMYGIPFDGYHAYTGSTATMQIAVAGLVEVVDARGPQMDQGETVTMFNDMCLFAPSTLIAPSLRWELIDSCTVRGIFTNKGHTISAVLTFDPSGALKNFVSYDRFLCEDGTTYLNYPWSTPVHAFEVRAGRRIPSAAEAVWHYPAGPRSYAQFDFTAFDYNVSAL
jgi:hypothetical protein